MKYSSRWLPQAALIILSISSACLLFTPYMGDDIINHNVWPNLGFTGAMSFAYELTIGWFVSNGRFFPVALFWMAGVFFFFQDLFTYKLFLLFLLAVQILLQRRWFLKISLGVQNRHSAVLLACVGCGIWSGPIPSVVPPFNSFHGMFILSGCLGLLLHLIWLNDKIGIQSKTIAAVSLVFPMLAIYELNIVFVLALLGVASSQSRDHRLLARARWMTAGSILYLGLIRVTATLFGVAPTSKYMLNPSTFSLSAFTKQFIAPFIIPIREFFNQFLALPYKSPLAPAGGIGLSVGLLLIALCASLVYWRDHGKLMPIDHAFFARLRYPLFFSILLLFAPPILFACQAYWQKEYVVTGAYLYVYYQLFGFSVLLYCVHQLIAFRLPRYRVAITALIFFVFLLTAVINIASTQKLVPGEKTVKPVSECQRLPHEC